MNRIIVTDQPGRAIVASVYSRNGAVASVELDPSRAVRLACELLGGLSPNPRNFPNQVDSMVWVCCPAELPSFSPSRTH